MYCAHLMILRYVQRGSLSGTIVIETRSILCVKGLIIPPDAWAILAIKTSIITILPSPLQDDFLFLLCPYSNHVFLHLLQHPHWNNKWSELVQSQLRTVPVTECGTLVIVLQPLWQRHGVDPDDGCCLCGVSTFSL